ncbi:MAG: TonB-dependent receptor [Nitrospirae bacterium]|nr:TonB-dependent receptor [Nitrospirota bacterium]
MVSKLFYGATLFFLLVLSALLSVSLFPLNLFAESGAVSPYVQSDPDEVAPFEVASAETLPEEGDEDRRVMMMYYGKDAVVVSPTRYLKPVSQTAENITIVTQEMMTMINAHTVAEALQIVPGVQVDFRNAFGSYSTANIQGAKSAYVRVMIDGVTMNDLPNNFGLIGEMPVQNIERIEIIKGPASSSWGSSLGGIINIVTKDGTPTLKGTGSLYGSYGKHNSGDFRADADGQISHLNYYVYGGNLGSKGFTPRTAYNADSFYTKEKLDITDKLKLIFTLGYNKEEDGGGVFPPPYNLTVSDKNHNLFSTLGLKYDVTNEVTVDLDTRYLNQSFNTNDYRLGTGALYSHYIDNENTKGATLKLTWETENQTLIVGSEYDDGQSSSPSFINKNNSLIKSAVFANDSFKNLIKDFYITPGLRFDYVNTGGNFVSPSLGVAYNPTEGTTCRFTVARGFNAPGLAQKFATGITYVPNPGLKVENVWSYQGGIETTMLQYVWLKLSLFRHDIDNGIKALYLDSQYHYTFLNNTKQRRQGLEFEVETFPVYHVVFNAGYAFVDAKDFLTETRMPGVGRHTLDIGAKYRGNFLTAYFWTHYIAWDSMAKGLSYGDRSFVFNLNLMKKLYQNGRNSVDIFLTGHNLFNASQYTSNTDNPRRWIEGGIRLHF